jgi:hypothetical protein
MIMMQCYRCGITSGYARVFDVDKCCDYGDYLLMLVYACSDKKDTQLRFGLSGKLYQDTVQRSYRKLTRSESARINSD